MSAAVTNDVRQIGQAVRPAQIKSEVGELRDRIVNLFSAVGLDQMHASVVWGQRQGSTAWEQGIALHGKYHEDQQSSFDQTLNELNPAERGKLIFTKALPAPDKSDKTVQIWLNV